MAFQSYYAIFFHEKAKIYKNREKWRKLGWFNAFYDITCYIMLQNLYDKMHKLKPIAGG